MRTAATAGLACWFWCSMVPAQPPEPPSPQPQRVDAYGHVVVDPHPGRIVLRRDAYTLVYDQHCRIPAWAAYEANRQTLLPIDQPPVPRRAIADEQVPSAPSQREALEILPEEGYRMVRLVPPVWMGGRRLRPLASLTAIDQADLVTNMLPMRRESAEAGGGLWAEVQQWIRELVAERELRLSVLAGCIIDRENPQRAGPRDGICIPSHYFLVLSRPAEQDGAVEILAFLFPHQQLSRGAIGDYATSLENIEALSGLDLFADLDDGRDRSVPRASRLLTWGGPAPPTSVSQPRTRSARAPQAAPSYSREAARSDAAPAEAVPVEAAPVEAAPEVRAPMPSPEIDAAMPDLVEAHEDDPPPRKETAGDVAAAAPAGEEDRAELKDRLVRVYYGTDRNRTDVDQPNDFYGADPADALALGVCRVSIPPVHLPGSGKLERPWPFMPENPAEHVVLTEVEELDQLHFVERLRAALLRSSEDSSAGKRQAFIFIHGYNNSFADAARRTAQMAFDLNLDIVPIMYTWPSSGNLWDYFRDRGQIESSVPHLNAFLRLVRDQCHPDRLHIICHSMGSDLFKEVVDDFAASDAAGRIDQIILAAPDIDANVFNGTIAPIIENVATRVTIYVSARDRALLSSRYANKSEDLRLGARAWDALYNFVKIDQVDVSAVDTSVVGHLYYGDNSGILADIRGVLRGTPAAQRELVAVSRHYAFPAPGCVYVDWDLRHGWELANFQHGWEVLLDRKVLTVMGLCLTIMGLMYVRIKWLKRALRR